MNEIKSILEVIRRMKTTVILILFVVFVLFYYKPLITELVETKVKKPDEVKKDINNNVLIQEMLNDLNKYCVKCLNTKHLNRSCFTRLIVKDLKTF